jgi:hypothetical protein
VVVVAVAVVVVAVVAAAAAAAAAAAVVVAVQKRVKPLGANRTEQTTHKQTHAVRSQRG